MKFIQKCWNSGYGLLILRLALGFAFIVHGLAHLNATMGTVAQFGMVGINSAALAYMATYGELLAGGLLILGVFTRIASLIIVVVMIVALCVKLKLNIAYLGGYELDIAYLASALAIMFSGSGALSLGKKFCGCGKCEVWRHDSCGCECGSCSTCEVKN